MNCIWVIYTLVITTVYRKNIYMLLHVHVIFPMYIHIYCTYIHIYIYIYSMFVCWYVPWCRNLWYGNVLTLEAQKQRTPYAQDGSLAFAVESGVWEREGGDCQSLASLEAGETIQEYLSCQTCHYWFDWYWLVLIGDVWILLCCKVYSEFL